MPIAGLDSMPIVNLDAERSSAETDDTRSDALT